MYLDTDEVADTPPQQGIHCPCMHFAGGYHLSSLGASVVASMHGLLQPSLGDAASLDHELGKQASAWMQPEPMAKVEDVLLRVQRLHEL